MRNKHLRLVLITVGMVIAWSSAPEMAQSAETTPPRCPAGFWLMDPLCMNNSTGDVVYAVRPVHSGVTAVLGCRAGYWRLDSLCVSPATGDVELASDQRLDGQDQHARRK